LQTTQSESRHPFGTVVRRHGTTHTVTVTGEVDLAVSDRLAGDLHALIAGRPETALVDLAAVSFIDSTGIRAIVGAHLHAVARDVHLVIVPPPARVFRTFQVCGLDRVLPFVGAPA
jgi:anti-sigma B factor antagonist